MKPILEMSPAEAREEAERRTREGVGRVVRVGVMPTKDGQPALPHALPLYEKNLKPRAPRRSKQMNKTEARYAFRLHGQITNGVYRGYEFEPITLRIADGVRFTPDFMVLAGSTENPRVELHEVKGAFIRDDARIKLRVAAQQYPCFTFYLAQWKDGQWTITKIEPTPGLTLTPREP